jgi:hypothetical protein
MGSFTGSRPFWKQFAEEDVAEAGGDDAAHAHAHQRPDRAFARGAAAEVLGGEHDVAALVGALVRDEVGVVAAVGPIAPTLEGVFAQTFTARADEALDRDDDIRVDIRLHEGNGGAFDGAESLHLSSS